MSLANRTGMRLRPPPTEPTDPQGLNVMQRGRYPELQSVLNLLTRGRLQPSPHYPELAPLSPEQLQAWAAALRQRAPQGVRINPNDPAAACQALHAAFAQNQPAAPAPAAPPPAPAAAAAAAPPPGPAAPPPAPAPAAASPTFRFRDPPPNPTGVEFVITGPEDLLPNGQLKPERAALLKQMNDYREQLAAYEREKSAAYEAFKKENWSPQSSPFTVGPA